SSERAEKSGKFRRNEARTACKTRFGSESTDATAWGNLCGPTEWEHLAGGEDDGATTSDVDDRALYTGIRSGILPLMITGTEESVEFRDVSGSRRRAATLAERG
ncbi:hypothetical protein K0M31_013655, partial [Melipona bicolor]